MCQAVSYYVATFAKSIWSRYMDTEAPSEICKSASFSHHHVYRRTLMLLLSLPLTSTFKHYLGLFSSYRSNPLRNLHHHPLRPDMQRPGPHHLSAQPYPETRRGTLIVWFWLSGNV
jgi:hypothetical protein